MKKTKTKKRVVKKTKAKRGTRLNKGWKLVQGISDAQWDPKALKELMKSERPPVKFNFVKTSIPSGIVENLEPFRFNVNKRQSHLMDVLRYTTSTPAATRGELGKAPAHYSNGKYTPWEIIDDWDLDYYCGNAMKYVCRHKHKGTPEQDIQKAIDCLIKYKANLSKETK